MCKFVTTLVFILQFVFHTICSSGSDSWLIDVYSWRPFSTHVSFLNIQKILSLYLLITLLFTCSKSIESYLRSSHHEQVFFQKLFWEISQNSQGNIITLLPVFFLENTSKWLLLISIILYYPESYKYIHIAFMDPHRIVIIKGTFFLVILISRFENMVR